MKLFSNCFKSLGHFFFKNRNALFPVLFLLAFLGFKPETLSSNELVLRVAALLGVAIAILGQTVRMSVIGYEYIKRGGKDRAVYAEDLVTGGFYQVCRNPMYLGNLLITCGILLFYCSGPLLLIALPFFILVYAAIISVEEEYLKNKFGPNYDNYCARVPSLVPRLSKIAETISSSKYNWRMAIRKEYGTLYGTIAGLILIESWKLFQQDKLILTSTMTLYLTSALILATIAYLLVRTLKKNGKLG
jgi:protein-S-isoprenylcysteine O-methyltransferase Ste14